MGRRLSRSDFSVLERHLEHSRKLSMTIQNELISGSKNASKVSIFFGDSLVYTQHEQSNIIAEITANHLLPRTCLIDQPRVCSSVSNSFTGRSSGKRSRKSAQIAFAWSKRPSSTQAPAQLRTGSWLSRSFLMASRKCFIPS